SLLPDDLLQLGELVAGETQPAARVVDANEIAERVLLAVDEVTGRAGDEPLAGQRQDVRHRFRRPDAGMMRGSLVAVTEDTALFEGGGQQPARRGAIVFERDALGGMAADAVGVGAVDVLAVRFAGRQRRHQPHRHQRSGYVSRWGETESSR